MTTMSLGQATAIALHGTMCATVARPDQPLEEKLAVMRIWVSELDRGPLAEHARYLLDVLVTAHRLAHETDDD